LSSHLLIGLENRHAVRFFHAKILYVSFIPHSICVVRHRSLVFWEVPGLNRGPMPEIFVAFLPSKSGIMYKNRPRTFITTFRIHPQSRLTIQRYKT